jgi:peptide deformylase
LAIRYPIDNGAPVAGCRPFFLLARHRLTAPDSRHMWNLYHPIFPAKPPSAAMARLPLIIAPDPRLKKNATPVSGVGPELVRLMDNMLETMYGANGIGLAAPQVGVLQRVIVVDVAGKDEEPQPIGLANPEVVWADEVLSSYNEGCLSLPEQYSDVIRPRAVRVRYLDRDNRAQEIHGDGLLATVLQHEIDHLDGVLFVDHISLLKRNMILRRLRKWKKAGSDD